MPVDRREPEEARDHDEVEQQDQRPGRRAGRGPCSRRRARRTRRAATRRHGRLPAIACMIDPSSTSPSNSATLTAIAQDGDPMARAQHLLELRRDEDARLALLGQVEDEALDLRLGADVDAARRLVEDQHLRVRRQPASQDDLLLVAAAQVPDELIRVGRGDLQELDVLVGDGSLLRRVRSIAASPDRPGPPGRCSRARSGRPRSRRPCDPPDRARRRARSSAEAGPTAQFLTGELVKIEQFLQRGGRLLVLLHPHAVATRTGLENLLAKWAILCPAVYAGDEQIE